MKRTEKNRGVLTIEATISYSIFLMVIVTMLYIMRIVYAYGLIQHATSQTAKELSMYTYVYQVAGVNDLRGQIASGTSDRTDQFNADAGEVVKFYEAICAGDFNASYDGTTDPREILKNVGGALLGEAGKEANKQLFEAVVRPLMGSYIGADSKGNSANERLEALRIVGGLSGLNLDSSSFFEDGTTIDLVVCYTVDPLFPIDIMPELNLCNRAYVRGMSGENIFGKGDTGGEKEDEEKAESVWDGRNAMERGKAIQKQQNVRNLPENFSTFSAFDASTGTATAEKSIDIRDDGYQKLSTIKGVISTKCKSMENYKTCTYGGVTVDEKDIKSRELILYIPSSTGGRTVDRSLFDQAVKDVRARYPGINITVKEID